MLARRSCKPGGFLFPGPAAAPGWGSSLQRQAVGGGDGEGRGAGPGGALPAASVPGALNAACEAKLQAEQEAEGLPATQGACEGPRGEGEGLLAGPSLVFWWTPGRPSGLAGPAAAARWGMRVCSEPLSSARPAVTGQRAVCSLAPAQIAK